MRWLLPAAVAVRILHANAATASVKQRHEATKLGVVLTAEGTIQTSHWKPEEEEFEEASEREDQNPAEDERRGTEESSEELEEEDDDEDGAMDSSGTSASMVRREHQRVQGRRRHKGRRRRRRQESRAASGHHHHRHHEAATLDCKWGQWGHWGSCSTSCGKGLRIRTRSIARPSQGGGKACHSKDAMQRDEHCNEKKTCPVGKCVVELCGKDLIKKTNFDGINCGEGKNCTADECCDKACSSFTCTGNYKPKDRVDTLPCLKPCDVDTCCQKK